MTGKKIIVAVDGHSSCGKSTLSQQLAAKLGYTYIDSGAMYRAVTLYALKNGLILSGKPDKNKLIAHLPSISITFRYNPAEQKSDTLLNGENVEKAIREPIVSNHVSPVAAIKEVRNAMVKIQQKLGRNKGIVMDGRDIGTVVYPHAELKIFMTASPDIRARRRYDELKNKGIEVTYDEIRQNVEQRDHIDQNRETSPLKKADDAVVLDNSHMTPDEQLQWAIKKVNEIITKDDY
ncbi:MAG: (d)CMP kinase [Prolixibacteraceae bacterium]|nr:(d)CMP kinase [Prolixibacteraceae bacterium]